MAERKVFKCHIIFRNMEKTGLSTIDIYRVTISGEKYDKVGRDLHFYAIICKSRAKSIAISSLELDKIQQWYWTGWECLEPGRLQKPGLPAAAPGNLHTFPRALITCLPLTA